MDTTVNLYSTEKGEIEKFLMQFLGKNINLENELEWIEVYDNPIEIADILGSFIDNNEKFKINMWISLDDGFLINVTNNNADDIIRYLYERYPY